MGGYLERINAAVWGVPTLVLILGVGLYITVRTGAVQISLFPCAFGNFLRSFRRKGKTDGVTPYQALCTALAATVGTGNLAGVAGAIALGGPGSIFWMWICAFLGMATKFAEATLAVHYRIRNKDGEYTGGPMYMIRRGMSKRWHPLAGIYSFFGVVAAFGVGNATQVNAVIGGVNSILAAHQILPTLSRNLLIGVILAVLIGMILLGGAKRIGVIAERLVPFAALVYILLCFVVLIARADYISEAFRSILTGAFSPAAVTGGLVGSAVISLRVGASRGTFTNEAGMGTAAIAHSGAKVRHPAEQGLMGIMEVFLDTIVICTLTALVILCSGVPVAYGVDTGVELTASAFSVVCGDWVRVVIAVSLCAFAIATVIGWGLYGMRCAQYLFGDHIWRRFVWIQIGMVLLGAVMSTGTVWILSETVNGLMAIPNLIVLLALTPKLSSLTKEYKKLIGRKSAVGGTYEDIEQCQPLRAVSYAKIPPSGSKSSQRRQKNLSPEHWSA